MLRLAEAKAREAVGLPFPVLGPADAGAESGCSRVREIAFCDAGVRPGIFYVYCIKLILNFYSICHFKHLIFPMQNLYRILQQNSQNFYGLKASFMVEL